MSGKTFARERRPLTAKQELFVVAYLNSLNATKAAIAAGYSARTAEQLGYQQLQKASVARAIVTRQAKRLQRFEITGDRVLRELAYIAFSRLNALFDAQNKLKPPSEWTDEEAAAIMGFEVVIKNAAAGDDHTDTIHKVKAADKVKALELLGRHLKLLEPEGQPIIVIEKLLAILDAGRQRNAQRVLTEGRSQEEEVS